MTATVNQKTENLHTEAHDAPPKTDDQERNAMRAYLQRAEVRLSTMHRVAVGFLSGAGLIFLFPVFLKDAILSIVREFLTYAPSVPASSGTLGIISVVALYLFILYPFVLSLSIPALALVLLLKDIVRFYFMGHAPGFPEEHFNPRFILTGIAFSPDESEAAKSKILAHQYSSDLMNFVISFDEGKAAYYGRLIDKPRRMIVPRTRRLPRLIERGILENNSGKSLDQLDDDDIVEVKIPDLTANPEVHSQRAVKEIDRFNAALGLSGFLDRPLHEEVAKQEVSLVRHALHLRRMVLRYFQAVMILLWSSLISFMLLPFLQDPQKRFPDLIVFAIGYFVWSLLTPFVVQLPVLWLALYSRKDIRRQALRHLHRTDGLEQFENVTKILCYISIVTSAIAIVLAIWLRFA